MTAEQQVEQIAAGAIARLLGEPLAGDAGQSWRSGWRAADRQLDGLGPAIITAAVAGVVIPSGQLEGQPLAEVLRSDAAEEWLSWAIRRDWPEPFRSTLLAAVADRCPWLLEAA